MAYLPPQMRDSLSGSGYRKLAAIVALLVVITGVVMVTIAVRAAK